MGYRGRKRLILGVLSVLTGLAVGAVCLFLPLRAWADALANSSWMQAAVAEMLRGAARYAEGIGQAGGFIGGALYGVKLWSGTAARLADGLFGDFRDDLFQKVRHPARAFAADHDIKGYIASDMGVREAGSSYDRTFEALRAFANGADPGQFGWTVLNGEAGVGKSRLTADLARTLARRERLGGEEGHPVRDTRTWLRQTARRFQTWCAGLAPQVFRSEAVWDAGYVTSSTPMQGERSLATFRPRRPTLLLLDDYPPARVAEVLRTLSREARSWRRCVRVIVVDQVLSVALEIDDAAGRPDGFVAPPEPLRTDPGARTGLVRALVTHAVGPAQAFTFGLKRDADFARLTEATEGNALLVLLALEQLQAGRSLSKLNSRTIPEGRAEAVRKKLEQELSQSRPHDPRGNETILDALMVSTLASGPEWAAWAAATGSELKPVEARALFPYAPEAPSWSDWDRAETAVAAPMLRPDLIGDAVVRDLLRQYGPGVAPQKAQTWVATAWRCGPQGMLRTMLRTRRRIGEADLLAEALARPPEPGWFEDPAEATPDMVRAAVTDQRDASFALPFIEACSPEALLAMADRLTQALDHWNARVEPAFALTSAIITRAGPAAQSVEQRRRLLELGLQALKTKVGRRLDNRAYADVGDGLVLALAPLMTLSWGEAGIDDLAIDMVRRLERHGANLEVSPWLTHVGSPIQKAWLETGLLNVDVRRKTMSLGDVEARVGGLESRVDPASQGRDETRLRAYAWRVAALAACQVPSGTSLDATEAHARRVDEIAAPYGDDRDLQLERAQAWGFAAFAACQVPLGASLDVAEGHARGVDEIAAPYGDDRNLQLERAKAWRLAAYAACQVPLGASLDVAEGHARRVDEIAAPYGDDRDVQGERAQAWSSAAYAACQVPLGASLAVAEGHARRVDEIATPFLPDEQFAQAQHKARSFVDLARRARDGAG